MLGGKKDSGSYPPNSESEEPALPEDVPLFVLHPLTGYQTDILLCQR